MLSSLLVIGACGDGKDEPENNKGGGSEIPIDPNQGGSATKKVKPKALWIDADANFSLFSTKQAIDSYVAIIKDAGFNQIYLDVKPGNGRALYASDILKPFDEYKGVKADRSWDYLGYWLEKCEAVDIDVIASISTMCYGSPSEKVGPVYDDDTWNGKTQCRMNNNNPNDIVDSKTETTSSNVAAALNPAVPEVQTYILTIVKEIATKYPKLKGICLDYCRWMSGYGFSDATISAFEDYAGVKLSSRNDIITSTGGNGKYYAKWIEFRASVIRNLVKNISEQLDMVNPDMELHLWASASYSMCTGLGQNWANTSYIPTGSRYTDTYNTTGFADYLDVFSMGAYTEYVWKTEYPNSEWTVENFCTTWSKYFTGSKCSVRGSIGTYSYTTSTQVSDAIYLALKNTDGIMIFEISHVINSGHWKVIKEAFQRAEK